MTSVLADFTNFADIPFGTTLRPASGYTADFFSQIISDLRGATKNILPSSNHFNGVVSVSQQANKGISAIVL